MLTLWPFIGSEGTFGHPGPSVSIHVQLPVALSENLKGKGKTNQDKPLKSIFTVGWVLKGSFGAPDFPPQSSVQSSSQTLVSHPLLLGFVQAHDPILGREESSNQQTDLPC